MSYAQSYAIVYLFCFNLFFQVNITTVLLRFQIIAVNKTIQITQDLTTYHVLK